MSTGVPGLTIPCNMSNVDYGEDDFVFKPATSPKLSNLSSEDNSGFKQQSSSSPQVSNTSSQLPSTSHSKLPNVVHTPNTNVRFTVLDAFINEKKKEIDIELNNLSKERLEEFISKEKAADQQREEELHAQVTSPKSDSSAKTPEDSEEFEALDIKEEQMLKDMREKAKETWTELKAEYQKSLHQMHTEQSARLSHELQLQESLQASGSVFDRELFEKVVEKCGKGRSTAYGKEKMARFWDVLDKSSPKGSASTPKTPDDDKILASLLGI